jgi:hypothetical protein
VFGAVEACDRHREYGHRIKVWVQSTCWRSWRVWGCWNMGTGIESTGIGVDVWVRPKHKRKGSTQPVGDAGVLAAVGTWGQAWRVRA